MSTCTMRAYALTGPREGEVQEVPAPVMGGSLGAPSNQWLDCAFA